MTQPRPLPRETELTAHVEDAPGGDAYVIEIPTGTAKADEIGIEATVDTITVTLRSQSRVFEFPTELDTDHVHAELKLGVLRITAPKAVAGKRRVIRVEQVA
jgi:HSP20 family molecular chaperone IbpA